VECRRQLAADLVTKCRDALLQSHCVLDECKLAIEWSAFDLMLIYSRMAALADDYHSVCLKLKEQDAGVKRYNQCKKDMLEESCRKASSGGDFETCMMMLETVTFTPSTRPALPKPSYLQQLLDMFRSQLPKPSDPAAVAPLDTHHLMIEVHKAREIGSSAYRIGDKFTEIAVAMTGADLARQLYVKVKSGVNAKAGSWASAPTDWNPSDKSVRFQGASHMFFDHHADFLHVGMFEKRGLTAAFVGDPQIGWGKVELDTSLRGQPKEIDVHLYRGRNMTALVTLSLQAFEREKDEEFRLVKTEL